MVDIGDPAGAGGTEKVETIENFQSSPNVSKWLEMTSSVLLSTYQGENASLWHCMGLGTPIRVPAAPHTVPLGGAALPSPEWGYLMSLTPMRFLPGGGCT